MAELQPHRSHHRRHVVGHLAIGDVDGARRHWWLLTRLRRLERLARRRP